MKETETIQGRILNIQHFCVDDGPGIRTTVFLKGCPLRCAWCHNPESQAFRRELMYRADACKNCGACSAACGNACHAMEDGSHTFDRTACKNCGSCSEVCAFDALQMAGQDKTVEEVMEELLPDKIFYESSGGGVTLSGGEPLSQPDFSYVLLKACKEEGIHTSVETCGFGKKETMQRIAEVTDLFLYDYKLTDPILHRKYTGVDIAPVLENLRFLHERGAAVILRCPMIPGVNLNEAHYRGIITLAQAYENIREIQLEPYHPLGVSKAEALGRTPEYDRKEFLEKSELAGALELIREHTKVPVNIN